MSQKLYEESNIQAIADAIRAQNGSTDTYLPSEMSTAIEELSVLDTSDATATEGDMASGVTAYVNGEKITGSLPTWSYVLTTYESNDMTVDNISSNPRTGYSTIFLSATQDFIGRVNGGGTYVRFSSSMLGDAGVSDVLSGKTFSSASGVKVTGTYTPPETLDTSDATATESDILDGQTAYVNGTKLTGTLVVQNYYTGATTPESTTGDDGDLYFKVTN